MTGTHARECGFKATAISELHKKSDRLRFDYSGDHASPLGTDTPKNELNKLNLAKPFPAAALPPSRFAASALIFGTPCSPEKEKRAYLPCSFRPYHTVLAVKALREGCASLPLASQSCFVRGPADNFVCRRSPHAAHPLLARVAQHFAFSADSARPDGSAALCRQE